MSKSQIPKPICIAVSRCLLGDEVRYDAQQQRDHFIADTLGAHFQWAPFCPEIEIGLGVPRPKIQLEHPVDGTDDDMWLVMPECNRNLTAKMVDHALRSVRRLKKKGVVGCLLKSRSPSCGPSRVKTFTADGQMYRTGVGFLAKAIMKMWPELPVEEDDHMHDPSVRDNWIERVFAYRRLQEFFSGGCSTAELAEFHAAQRLVLLSHSRQAYDELGQVLHEFEETPDSRVSAQVAQQYCRQFMATLRRPATRAKHAAVLRRILSLLKPGLDADTRRQLAAKIDDYRQAEDGAGVPLVVPRALLAHFADVLDVAELRKQVYLYPDPLELALRNHA